MRSHRGRGVVGIVFISLVAACSEERDPSPESAMTAGIAGISNAGTATAGAGVGGLSVGGAGAAGGSTAGRGGETAGVGGASGAAGATTAGQGGSASETCPALETADPAAPGAATMPEGRFDACAGSCPKGECDSHPSPFSPGCATLYSCDLAEFPYCNANTVRAYCLVTGGEPTGLGDYSWVVTCTGDSPSFEYCPNGCGAPSDGDFYCL